VTYMPTFFRVKTGLNIDMYLQNQSPIPANVLYANLTSWIDDKPFGPSFFNLSPDLLYQGKGGISSLPPLDGKVAKRLDQGDTAFLMGVCVLYASTSKWDTRRWQLQALYKYVPGSSLP